LSVSLGLGNEKPLISSSKFSQKEKEKKREALSAAGKSTPRRLGIQRHHSPGVHGDMYENQLQD